VIEPRSLFVDPGLRACGVAVFHEGRLERAGLPLGVPVEVANMRRPSERETVLKSMALAVRAWSDYVIEETRPANLFIELPRVYPRGHHLAATRGTDSNDLVDLAAVVGAIVCAFATCNTTIKFPAEWKGTMPKHIMHERALVILTPEEKAVIPLAPRSKKPNHNTMDAVCMGLATFGRLRTV
jgi:hypothetical protein